MSTVQAVASILAAIERFEDPKEVRLILPVGFTHKTHWIQTLTDPWSKSKIEPVLEAIHAKIHPDVVLWRRDIGRLRTIRLHQLQETSEEAERIRIVGMGISAGFKDQATAIGSVARTQLGSPWVEAEPEDFLKARGARDAILLWVNYIYVAYSAHLRLTPAKSGLRKVVVCEQGISCLSGRFMGSSVYELGVEQPPTAGMKLTGGNVVAPLIKMDLPDRK